MAGGWVTRVRGLRGVLMQQAYNGLQFAVGRNLLLPCP